MTGIYCDKKALYGFKLRAGRRFPREYLELMFGETIAGSFEIQHFEGILQTAGKEWLKFDDDDFQKVVAETEADTGLDYLGTIHTHSNGNPCPSDTDNVGAREWAFQDKYFAIDTITGKPGRRVHSIEFWTPQEPVPLLLT